MKSWDKTEALGQTLNQPKMLKVVIEAFLEDSEALLETMNKAIEQEDWSQLRQSAHAFKGSSANIAAHALSERAKNLQVLLDSNNIELVADHFASFLEELRKLRAILQDFISER